MFFFCIPKNHLKPTKLYKFDCYFNLSFLRIFPKNQGKMFWIAVFKGVLYTEVSGMY